MNLEDKCALLDKMPLFAGCIPTEIEVIAEDTTFKAFSKNTLTIESDAAAHRLYIIANRGRMKVSASSPATGEELIVCLLSFGDIFNLMTLIDDKKDHLTATGIDDIDILYCSIDRARHWVDKFPSYRKNLLIYLSKRLRQVQNFNIGHTFYSLEIRLAMLIFKNIASEDTTNLLDDLPHSELAKLLGTTRAVVNRSLQKLKKDGLIEIQRKRILIRDYERLKSLTEAFEIR